VNWIETIASLLKRRKRRTRRTRMMKHKSHFRADRYALLCQLSEVQVFIIQGRRGFLGSGGPAPHGLIFLSAACGWATLHAFDYGREVGMSRAVRILCTALFYPWYKLSGRRCNSRSFENILNESRLGLGFVLVLNVEWRQHKSYSNLVMQRRCAKPNRSLYCASSYCNQTEGKEGWRLGNFSLPTVGC
jgi:hypothetical protein